MTDIEVSEAEDQAGTFGRYRETPVEEMPTDMQDAYELVMRLRGGVPGPHKIWLANPKLITAIVTTGAYFQTDSTLSKAEIEIATNAIVGKWHAAYATHEHERIAVEQGGLTPQQSSALIAGLPTSFDDPRAQVVYELASTLIAARIMPVELFRRAQDLLGDKGIVDVTMLLSWYTGVSLTLATYDVPSDARGLLQ